MPRDRLEAAQRALRATPLDDTFEEFEAFVPSAAPRTTRGSPLGARVGKALALLGILGTLAGLCGSLWNPAVFGLAGQFLPLAILGGMVAGWSAPRAVEPA